MANKYVKSFNFGGDTLYPLPIVTAEQNGQVLKVVDGKWGPAEMITGPKLIEFNVYENDTTSLIGTYQAKEGMTWGEFIDSDYNSQSYFTYTYLDETGRVSYQYMPLRYDNDMGTFVNPLEVIDPSRVYVYID